MTPMQIVIASVVGYFLIGGILARLTYLRIQRTCATCDADYICDDHRGDIQLTFFLWGFVAVLGLPVLFCLRIGDVIDSIIWGRREREAAQREKEANS